MLPPVGAQITNCEPKPYIYDATATRLLLHEGIVLIYFQDGNPFGPFWDYVGVEFDTSVLFGGISFSAYHQPQWMKK